MRRLEHSNLVRFVGVCIDGPDDRKHMIITEYCSKGSLQVTASPPPAYSATILYVFTYRGNFAIVRVFSRSINPSNILQL